MAKRQLTDRDPEFAEWWRELNELAKGAGCPWVISPDQEPAREYYDDGLDPEEAFAEYMDDANR